MRSSLSEIVLLDEMTAVALANGDSLNSFRESSDQLRPPADRTSSEFRSCNDPPMTPNGACHD